MSSRPSNEQPNRVGGWLPNTRNGAAFFGFIIIGLCALICDDIAVALGRSGNKSLGWTVLGIWIAGLALTAAIWLRAYRLQRAIDYENELHSGVCFQCGYNLSGNVSGICPECGMPVQSARTDDVRSVHLADP
jgi:hypothetical protein